MLTSHYIRVTIFLPQVIFLSFRPRTTCPCIRFWIRIGCQSKRWTGIWRFTKWKLHTPFYYRVRTTFYYQLISIVNVNKAVLFIH
jgi:hypothetical protein